MPAGVGLHPYFPKTADVALRALTPRGWPRSPAAQPIGAEAVPEAWDFSAGRTLGTLDLDNCFAGWDGVAVVSWPGRRLAVTMSADPTLGILCVWSPPGEPFFCAEPVSNVSDAFFEMARGTPGHGLRVIEPGEVLAGTVRFAPTRTDS